MLLTPPTHRALLVEDDPADARLVQELLNESGDTFELTVADRLSSALDLLSHEHFAVVLVDLELPDASRAEALDSLRSQLGSTPVVVYSGHPDDTAAGQARQLGVSDVLRKGSLDGPELVTALRAIVAAAEFEEAVRSGLRTAKAVGADIAVIRLVAEATRMLPARPVGRDPALQRAMTERFAARLGAKDGLFDLGDHRYGVVAEVGDGAAGAVRLAGELERALDRPITLPDGPVGLSVRTGVAFSGSGRGTAADLLSRASSTLRASGTLPRSAPLSLAPSPPSQPTGEISFASRLEHAIQADELVLHYQPIVQLGDDTVSVVEALVRWEDPVRGLLFAEDFIPQAEETSLIEEVGAWALLEACRQMKAWDEQGLAPVRCAVNLSARELCSAALPARVADALAATGLAPDRLEVELTESMFADPDGAAHMIGRLRAIGVRVAIDDFGTGYSSLAYLTRFSVDTVKVDGGFVRRAAEDPDSAAVVKAIVGIAKQLELDVIAEGVETAEQLAFVRRQGCDLVQGWLFSPAMAGPVATEWLAWAREQVEDRKAGRGSFAAAISAGRTPAVPEPLAEAGPGAGERVGVSMRQPSKSMPRARIDRAVLAATGVAGCVLGSIVAFPADLPAAENCSTAGAGQAACLVQRGWITSGLIFLACVLAVMVAVDLVYRMPERVRRHRAHHEADLRRRTEAAAERARLARAQHAPGWTRGASHVPLLLAENFQLAEAQAASPA